MTSSQRAIDYPRLVLMGALVVCLLGAMALFTLPRERTPRIRLPVIVVTVPNPGSSPVTNETQIVRKLQDEAGSLKGLKETGGIISHAGSGVAIVQFVFDERTPVEQARRDVESLVNRVKGHFPPEAQQNPGPTVKDVAFDQLPMLQVFVAGGSGGSDGEHRRRIAENLQDRLERIPGVAAADLFGGLEREVQIEVDPHRMVLYGFTYQQLDAALRRANLDAPAGAIESAGGSDAQVRASTRLGSIDDIAAVPVGVRDGKPIVLADVAQVSMGHQPRTSLARYGGQDAVVLVVRGKREIDVLRTANRVQEAVDEFVVAGLNEGLEVGAVRSQARGINFMIDQLSSNAVQGAVILIIVLCIAFGWRNASLITISLPCSIIGTWAFMWLAKQTFAPDIAINNMTLFAIILVIGEVVDGALVVGENIYRHRELGKPPVQAAKQGIAEVGPSLFWAYMTTFAGYAPLLLIGGMMGEFLAILPLVAIFSLVSAMLVDHYLIPVLSVYLMRPRPGPGPRKEDSGAPVAQADPVERELAAAEKMMRSPLRRAYGSLLERVLEHRLLAGGVLAIALVSPLALHWSGAMGFELMPEADIPIVEINFELPLGSSMEKRSALVAEQIEQATLRAVKPEEWYRPARGAAAVKPVTTIGDAGALNTRLDSDQSSGPEFGLVHVELVLAEERQRSVMEIRAAIQRELPPLPGVIVRISTPGEGPPVGPPVVVRVTAQRDTPLEALAERAAEVERLLRSVPGARDVTSDYRVRQELVLRPDRAAASLFGVDAAQVATSVSYALDGVRVGEVELGGDDSIEMRLRNLASERDQLDDLANLPLRSPTGRVVSLEQVAQVTRALAPSVIQQRDRRGVINLRCDLQPGARPDDVKAALVAALRADLSPLQQHALVHERDSRILASDAVASIEFGGDNQLRDEAAGDLKIALLLALAGNLIILVIQFNSFSQALIVLLSVPLSLIGVALGLSVCGMPFSVMAMIGIVALSGVVVDNAMLMVEFYNQRRRKGVPPRQAALQAGQLRVRPICLTSITSIVALVPTALNLSGGGELWVPIAVSIIGGLGFATLVQLLVVPAACYSLDPERWRRGAVWVEDQDPLKHAAPVVLAAAQ